MATFNQASVRRFREEGYLVAEGVLDVERDIQPVVDEYAELLEEVTERWYADGKLASTYRDLPFGQRLAKVLESGQAYYQYFDISLPQANVTLDTPIHLGEAVFGLLRSPRLLDAVESLIGPEIYSNPIQHVRIKPPERLVPEGHRNSLTATTDWHQDQGVIIPEADASEILTVWLPIVDATVENGCLRLIPGSHRDDLMLHCLVGREGRKGLHIPDQFLRPEETIPVPVKRGGVLFLHRRTMHASLSNRSDGIRWSFDLRYNPIGQPTGRPAFPGFVARSRRNPETELRSTRDWATLWQQTRARLAESEKPTFNRWTADSPACA
ncbi:MAG: phytanoyl-CoA dioxygenase family protein [Chloroflexi bacterium]|nr:phytanoyl-CoA dioxygenase family protein [Chloroflexota bacterium]